MADSPTLGQPSLFWNVSSASTAFALTGASAQSVPTVANSAPTWMSTKGISSGGSHAASVVLNSTVKARHAKTSSVPCQP